MIVPLPRRVLIMGGTGHTGERVAHRLRRLNVQVRVLTRFPNGPVANALRQSGCEIVEGDCLRRWTIWQALEDCNALVTCSHIRFADVYIQACLRAGVDRLICMSSARKYSKISDPTVGQVQKAESAIKLSETDWTILRPTMIFGGSRDNNVTRLVRWLEKRNWFPVFGDGQALVQPLFVEDLVTAILETLRRPDTAKKEYDLAGPEPLLYDDFIRQIASALKREIRIMHIPIKAGLGLAKMAPKFLLPKGFSTAMIERMAEDKDVEIWRARDDLDFAPRSFAEGIATKIAGEAEVEELYTTQVAKLVD